MSKISEPFSVYKQTNRYKEWDERRKGQSWKGKLQETIDRVLRDSRDFDDFLARMRSKGYEVKLGKNISFPAPGQERFARSKTLGPEYTLGGAKIPTVAQIQTEFSGQLAEKKELYETYKTARQEMLSTRQRSRILTVCCVSSHHRNRAGKRNADQSFYPPRATGHGAFYCPVRNAAKAAPSGAFHGFGCPNK